MVYEFGMCLYNRVILEQFRFVDFALVPAASGDIDNVDQYLLRQATSTKLSTLQ